MLTKIKLLRKLKKDTYGESFFELFLPPSLIFGASFCLTHCPMLLLRSRAFSNLYWHNLYFSSIFIAALGTKYQIPNTINNGSLPRHNSNNNNRPNVQC